MDESVKKELTSLRKSISVLKSYNAAYRTRIEDQNKCISNLLDERERNRKVIERLTNELGERDETISQLERKANRSWYKWLLGR